MPYARRLHDMTDEQQPDFWPTKAEACRRRDEGMKRSSDHAERVTPEWNAQADAAFRHYLNVTEGRSFLTEEFIAWARVQPDIDMPPDDRAFGSVIRRASLAHVIDKVGAAPANTSNLGLKTLWRKSAL